MKKLTYPPLRKLLALMMIGYVTNSHATIVTYDAPNQTLTIPQVMVGNATYSNVVVKLGDNFKVLQVDPNPLAGIVNGGVLMQVVSAVKSGNEVTVTTTVTSQFQDRSLNVGNDSTNCGGGISYALCAQMTDDQGNLYNASSTQVGIANPTSSWVKFPFVANIPMMVTYTYTNVATNASSIGLLHVNFNDGINALVANYQLRNIPFQAPTVSPLK
ncbi:MAG: hypothetical protein HOP02_08920 [Methylococcaceae bacterium]|nr:hypothetical protein [Methylococcaceae bacterium]